MVCKHYTMKIQSASRVTFDDVTDFALTSAAEAGVKDGLVTVYSQHTTCAVFIQEQSDDTDYYGTQFVLRDMVNGLEKIFPDCNTQGLYLHPGKEHIAIAKRERGEEAWWSLNTDAHLRSVALGRSVTFPLADSKAILGEFGRVYFADFDRTRARERTVWVTVMGQ